VMDLRIAILRLNVLNVFKIKLEKIKNKFWDEKIFKLFYFI